MMLLAPTGGGLKCSAGPHESGYWYGSHALKTQLEKEPKSAGNEPKILYSDSPGF